MAREAGFTEFDLLEGVAEMLVDFAVLVAAAEREECAKVAEDYWSEGYTVREIAAEIRARGEQ
jgi:hypothetical protein